MCQREPVTENVSDRESEREKRGESGHMIFTNYNKLYVRPHMRLSGAVSIMLWCNGISLVSSTPSLNVTLGCGSHLPYSGRASSAGALLG